METSGLIGEDDRRIALPGTLNLRDLGGYPAAGGGTVRWRTLLRSDALHRLDDAGRAVLAGLGLRTVIDLRTDEEVKAAPSALDVPARKASTSRCSATRPSAGCRPNWPRSTGT